MLLPVRFMRTAMIAVCLASLAVVLFPRYTEPLWDWAKLVSGSIANDPLPSFSQTQHYSGLALAGFVLCGIGYNVWRDKQYRALQAEYAYRTNANHLKEKVADLEGQMRKLTVDRDRWEEAYLCLTKQHAAALVASKEHEVRSEYGRADHQALGDMRKEFDALVKAKGNMEGFREAMHFFLTNMAEADKIPEVTVEATPNGTKTTTLKKRASLPFMTSSTT